MSDRHHLEHLAHGAGIGQPHQAASYIAGLGRRGSAFQGVRPLLDSKIAQETALRYRPENRGAARLSRLLRGEQLMILLATLVLLVTGKMMSELILTPSNRLAPSEMSRDQKAVKTVQTLPRTTGARDVARGLEDH